MEATQEKSKLDELHEDWGAALIPVVCESCDWNYLSPSEQPLIRCPHCFQEGLTPFEPDLEALPYAKPPELVLPYALSQEMLEQGLITFSRGIWFAPGDLKPASLLQRTQRLFLPMWLVDAQVEARWQAEAGYDYQVVSHREQYDQNRGGWVTQEVTETRVRWEPRLGKLQRAYHNIPAPALEAHDSILREVGEFDLTKGLPYSGEEIKGWIVKLPDRSPEDVWPVAVPAFQSVAAQECRQAMSAEHIRQFQWSAEYERQNWTLLLLPVLMTYYLDEENQVQPVIIHGQTGRIDGGRRASMKRAQRVSLLILLAALVSFFASLAISLAGLAFPPAAIIGGLGIVLAIVIAISAAIPVGWVWQFNRRQA